MTPQNMLISSYSILIVPFEDDWLGENIFKCQLKWFILYVYEI